MEKEKLPTNHVDLLLISTAWNTSNPQVSPELRQLFLMNLCRVRGIYPMSLSYSPMHLAPSSDIETMSKSLCWGIRSINLALISQKWDSIISKIKNRVPSMFISIVRLNYKWCVNILSRLRVRAGKQVTPTLLSITPNSR